MSLLIEQVKNTFNRYFLRSNLKNVTSPNFYQCNDGGVGIKIIFNDNFITIKLNNNGYIEYLHNYMAIKNLKEEIFLGNSKNWNIIFKYLKKRLD